MAVMRPGAVMPDRQAVLTLFPGICTAVIV